MPRGLSGILRGAGRSGDDVAQQADTIAVDASTLRGLTSNTTQRTASDSRLVSSVKWGSLGAAGYGGAQAARSIHSDRAETAQQEEQTARWEDFVAHREEILNSDLPPEIKQQRLEALEESYQAGQGGDDGGSLSFLTDMGLMEQITLFIALVIIFLVIRGGS